MENNGFEQVSLSVCYISTVVHKVRCVNLEHQLNVSWGSTMSVQGASLPRVNIRDQPIQASSLVIPPLH